MSGIDAPGGFESPLQATQGLNPMARVAIGCIGVNAVHYQITHESLFTFRRMENPYRIVVRLAFTEVHRRELNVAESKTHTSLDDHVGKRPRFRPINAEGLQSLSLHCIVAPNDGIHALDRHNRNFLSSFNQAGNTAVVIWMPVCEDNRQ